MREFNEIREEILKKAIDVADITMGLAKKASDKGKMFARIARLSAEIAGEKDVIKKNYAEIGKLYFEKYADNADDDMLQLVEEIKAAQERMDEKKAEIEELKAENTEDDVEVEICTENEYADDEETCEEAEETCEEAEETCEEAEETCEEAAEEAIEEAGEEAAEETSEAAENTKDTAEQIIEDTVRE